MTQAELKDILEYNPETGSFRWVAIGKGRRYDVGSVDSVGYRCIRIDYIQHKAGRLAWLYVTGSWPTGQIVHKDGNLSNLKWANLADCTKSEVQHLRTRPPEHNTSGILGVRFRSRDNVWIASCQINGVTHSRSCETKADAIISYREMKLKVML